VTDFPLLSLITGQRFRGPPPGYGGPPPGFGYGPPPGPRGFPPGYRPMGQPGETPPPDWSPKRSDEPDR